MPQVEKEMPILIKEAQKKLKSITIREVANGFVVVPGGVVRGIGEYHNDEHISVYASVIHLSEAIPGLFYGDVIILGRDGKRVIQEK